MPYVSQDGVIIYERIYYAVSKVFSAYNFTVFTEQHFPGVYFDRERINRERDGGTRHENPEDLIYAYKLNGDEAYVYRGEIILSYGPAKILRKFPII